MMALGHDWFNIMLDYMLLVEEFNDDVADTDPFDLSPQHHVP
jgi:hypothetical protein